MPQERVKKKVVPQKSKSTSALRRRLQPIPHHTEKEKYEYVHARLERVANNHKNFTKHLKWLHYAIEERDQYLKQKKSDVEDEFRAELDQEDRAFDDRTIASVFELRGPETLADENRNSMTILSGGVADPIEQDEVLTKLDLKISQLQNIILKEIEQTDGGMKKNKLSSSTSTLRRKRKGKKKNSASFLGPTTSKEIWNDVTERAYKEFVSKANASRTQGRKQVPATLMANFLRFGEISMNLPSAASMSGSTKGKHKTLTRPKSAHILRTPSVIKCAPTDLNKSMSQHWSLLLAAMKRRTKDMTGKVSSTSNTDITESKENTNGEAINSIFDIVKKHVTTEVVIGGQTLNPKSKTSSSKYSIQRLSDNEKRDGMLVMAETILDGYSHDVEKYLKARRKYLRKITNKQKREIHQRNERFLERKGKLERKKKFAEGVKATKARLQFLEEKSKWKKTQNKSSSTKEGDQPQKKDALVIGVDKSQLDPVSMTAASPILRSPFKRSQKKKQENNERLFVSFENYAQKVYNAGGGIPPKQKKEVSQETLVHAVIIMQKIFRGFASRLYTWALRYLGDPSTVDFVYKKNTLGQEKTIRLMRFSRLALELERPFSSLDVESTSFRQEIEKYVKKASPDIISSKSFHEWWFDNRVNEGRTLSQRLKVIQVAKRIVQQHIHAEEIRQENLKKEQERIAKEKAAIRNNVVEKAKRVKKEEDMKNRLGLLPFRLQNILKFRLTRIVDIFKEMDHSNDGVISRGEFVKGMRRLHIDLSSEEVTRIFEVFDANGDGDLNYKEFTMILQKGKMADRKNSLVEENQQKFYAEMMANDYLTQRRLRRLKKLEKEKKDAANSKKKRKELAEQKKREELEKENESKNEGSISAPNNFTEEELSEAAKMKKRHKEATLAYEKRVKENKEFLDELTKERKKFKKQMRSYIEATDNKLAKVGKAIRPQSAHATGSSRLGSSSSKSSPASSLTLSYIKRQTSFDEQRRRRRDNLTPYKDERRGGTLIHYKGMGSRGNRRFRPRSAVLRREQIRVTNEALNVVEKATKSLHRSQSTRSRIDQQQSRKMSDGTQVLKEAKRELSFSKELESIDKIRQMLKEE
eukprot:g1342.t1